jgi:hypothetical protein
LPYRAWAKLEMETILIGCCVSVMQKSRYGEDENQRDSQNIPRLLWTLMLIAMITVSRHSTPSGAGLILSTLWRFYSYKERQKMSRYSPGRHRGELEYSSTRSGPWLWVRNVLPLYAWKGVLVFIVGHGNGQDGSEKSHLHWLSKDGPSIS